MAIEGTSAVHGIDERSAAIDSLTRGKIDKALENYVLIHAKMRTVGVA